jgi:predicted nuclease of restriction endonuclease-like (RecB) superfamily
MSDLTPSSENLEPIYQRIRDILTRARHRALQTVNAEMVRAYWEIGREIVEEEQRGQARAGYGKQIVENLSTRLRNDFGRGFDRSNLWHMRDFYRTFPILDALRRELSWTHYRLLLRVEKPEARAFYEQECAAAQWSTRELERQIDSLLYERLALSRDKSPLRTQAEQGQEAFQPSDLIKDPYVLEFTGLPEPPGLQESDLEQVLMDRLQTFLLELGRDIFFVARQKRIVVEGDTFYIDLVFYHRMLRCFLLIDLKIGKLTHHDIGQMLFYTGYYEAEEMHEDENPPVGLILCTDKNDAVVRYTLSKTNQQIFASRYKLYLPTEEELQEELQRGREMLEMDQRLASEGDPDAMPSDEDSR